LEKRSEPFDCARNNYLGNTPVAQISWKREDDNVVATVVALMDDLFFLAKIRETAKVVGVKVVAYDTRQGPAAIAEAQPQAIFLDLNSRGLPAVDLIRALKADPATQAIRIVGFVSHVQEELIYAARAAGCDTVMARSAFTQQLPKLLKSLATECKQES
jgi:CheY-like chemotaxis protein